MKIGWVNTFFRLGFVFGTFDVNMVKVNYDCTGSNTYFVTVFTEHFSSDYAWPYIRNIIKSLNTSHHLIVFYMQCPLLYCEFFVVYITKEYSKKTYSIIKFTKNQTDRRKVKHQVLTNGPLSIN